MHLAICRVPGLKNFCVAGDKLASLLGDTNIKLPVEAINFVQDFDQGKPVKPFSFFVRIP